MKIATLYRKDGKVILETDNDAIAQVATDTPQDVVVMAAHYLTDARPPAQAERRFAGEAPAHADHGRGTLEGGPDDGDCPCRATQDQGACAAAGCGFCMSAQDVPPQGIAALRQIATELRTRHVADPSPTLVTFADRIDEAIRELAGLDNDRLTLCDLCQVREEVCSDAEGVPFCQERWDGWQAEEAKAVQP